METPERTDAQRREALVRANDIRSARARFKQQMKRTAPGESLLMAVDLLRSPPPEMSTMKAGDLIVAVPRVGSVKRNKLLHAAQVAQSKTLGGLTSRQREELAKILLRHPPSPHARH